MDKDIENAVKSCKTDLPWSRILIHFAGRLEGYYYLIVIGSFSKYSSTKKKKTTKKKQRLKLG